MKFGLQWLLNYLRGRGGYAYKPLFRCSDLAITPNWIKSADLGITVTSDPPAVTNLILTDC